MILPIVKEQSLKGESFPVPADLSCTFEGELAELGAKALVDFEPRVTLTKGAAFITFAADDSLEQKPEIYRVRVERDGIRVSFRDARGAVNGAASVALMLRKNELEVTEITDWPCDSFRSVMIDPGYCPPTVQLVKDTVRYMALAKYNRLHLHLVESHGPGYVSEALPDYKFTPKQGDRKGTPLTLDELREINEFCKRYAIEITPEVEFPGHAYQICEYDPDFKCQVENAQSWAVCPGSEKLYDFIDAQVGELAAVFPESEYFHMGSDELEFLDTPAGIDPLLCHWTDCPRCKALREREGLADMREEYYYFMERCRAICQKHGKKMMIWSEQVDVSKPVPEWFSRDILMEFWRVAARGRGPHDGCSLEGLLKQGFTAFNAYYPYAYTYLERYFSSEKMKTWTAHNVPEQPAECYDQMLGGELCIWDHATPGEFIYNRYVTPAALYLFGDKLWAQGEREYTDEYKAAFAEFLFGDASFVKVFECVGDLIPPRTSDFFTYLDEEQLKTAPIAATIEMLRTCKEPAAPDYVWLLEQIDKAAKEPGQERKDTQSNRGA